MSNEEKIIKMLGTLQDDVNVLKSDLRAIKRERNIETGTDETETKNDGLKKALDHWFSLPKDDEMNRFFAFMDAEEARKAALYGA